MGKVTISEILPAIKGKVISGNPEKTIDSFSTDTRALKKGDFFIPLKGEKYDGHQFIAQAITRGASGTFIAKKETKKQSFLKDDLVVIEVEDTLDTLQNLALYYRKKFNPFVIVITGSNGKTTTKELLGNILNKFFPTLVNYASWNNQIGLPLTLLQLEPVHRYCVLEMGTNHPGEIASLSRIAQPQMVIFTNIGRTHLEFFGTTEGVFKEKISVLEFLPPDGEVIYNADDRLLGSFSFPFKKTGFGIEQKTDFQANEISEENGKTNFLLHYAKEKIPVSLPLLGKFNVYNTLAAIAASFSKNADLEKIIQTLESFTPLPGRMNVLRLSNGAILIDDTYNANPDSMRQALAWFFDTYSGEEKIIVLGDMLELGGVSEKEHYTLGEYIAHLPVEVILLYGKEILSLAKAIKDNSSKTVLLFEEKKKLTEKLRNYLKTKPVIFFKASRAMKLEEVVDTLIQTDKKETIQRK